MKRLFRTLVGLIFGAFSSLALSPAAAAFRTDEGGASMVVFLAAIIIGGVLGFFAPTVRRAFGRGFLLLGASVFALPISMMLLSGRVVSDMVQSSAAGDEAMTAIGSGAAGALMTGASVFIGGILGLLFIIIGLVLALGGRREVIIRNV